MEKNLILAIDQGTTGTTAMLVDKNLNVLATKNVEYKQHYPRPGLVEHDLNDIWSSTQKAIRSVLMGKNGLAKKIAAIGITNQRETVCFWSKKTKKPLSRAIVWQDRRTASICDELKQKGLEPLIQKQSGLLLDPYFSATKISWALKNNETIKKAAQNNDLCFGTIDSYILHCLTSGEAHATEPSNASRTMLYDLEKNSWSDELLSLFEIPKNILPQVLNSNSHFGVTKNTKVLPDGIPITGILGDQQAALLGQACIHAGNIKCTYGTGSFILLNTGHEIKRSNHRLLTTIAWKLSNETTYALEGSAFTAGASVQWLRDNLKFIKKSSEVEKLALKVKTSDGVVFIPAFTGIGAPYWNANARAAIFGITRGTKPEHIARAVLEGVALMNHDVIKAMEKDLGFNLKTVNVDGGMSSNNLLMQIQADLLNTTLIRPKIIETTVLGAVFIAGLGVGLWQDLNAISKTWKKEKVFKPNLKNKNYIDELKKNWAYFIQRV